MVKAAEPYSAVCRWLASGQYTVVGHEAYAVGQPTAAAACCWPGLAWD